MVQGSHQAKCPRRPPAEGRCALARPRAYELVDRNLPAPLNRPSIAPSKPIFRLFIP
jgi:hypothetical protein